VTSRLRTGKPQTFFLQCTDLHFHPELEDATLEAVLVEPGQVGHRFWDPACRTKVYFGMEYIKVVRGLPKVEQTAPYSRLIFRYSPARLDQPENNIIG
jgi:hypothetical protein